MFGLSDDILIYKEYIKELGQYDDYLASMSDMDIADTVYAYRYQEDTEWVDIYYNRRIVGFMIVSSNDGECHPDADKEICQIYVRPEYRRKHLAYSTVANYLMSHPGIYSYDIFKTNNQAQEFWESVLKRVHARTVDLNEVRTDPKVIKNLDLYGCVVEGNTK